MRTTQAKFVEKGQAVTEKQNLQFLTPRRSLRMEWVATAHNLCTMLDELLLQPILSISYILFYLFFFLYVISVLDRKSEKFSVILFV